MRRLSWLLAAIAASALAQPTDEAAPSPAIAPPPLDAAPAPVPATPVRLVLANGQPLQCELLAETSDAITVRVGTGAAFQIPRTSIRSIEYPGPKREDPWFHDTNATRYLYSPTGFMLRQGEGYLSQKELVVSSFGYGVTDHFNVVIGAAVPAWLYGQMNMGAGFKLGASASELVHLAVGAQGLFLPLVSLSTSPPIGMVVAHGTATYGTPRANATVTMGGVFALTTSGITQRTLLVSVGALYRVSPHLVLQTENLLFPMERTPFTGEPFLMLLSAGVRLMIPHWALDLGVARFPGAPYPLPWIDFTYSFGP